MGEYSDLKYLSPISQGLLSANSPSKSKSTKSLSVEEFTKRKQNLIYKSGLDGKMAAKTTENKEVRI